MDTNFSQQEYFDLIKELNKAAENYYYAAKSIMTDALYDEKYLQLQSIEKEHPDWVTKESPTQRVGAPIKVAKTFKTGKHSHPMLSLKTETDYTSEGAIAFDKRVKEELGVDKVEYVAEPKFDGLGIDLKYENGSLVQALTRGDGVVGKM
jgi:DNA ligase (NAD+)